MDRDLIEKLLTAQVLTLAEAIRQPAQQGIVYRHVDYVAAAVKKIKERQAEVIGLLTAPPPPSPDTPAS